MTAPVDLIDPLIRAETGWWLMLVCAAGLVVARALPSMATVRLRGALTRAAGGGRTGAATRAEADGPPAVVATMTAWLRARIDGASGRASRRRGRAVIELCRALAAELRAGRAPLAAVESGIAALDPPIAAELAPVVAAARGGRDPVDALRDASALPGAAGLRYLGACWSVAAGTGAGLADVIDRLAESLAQEDAARREVAAHLSGPRTTAIVLSVLPALGLAMSTALGGAPLAFLFGTPAGLSCLGAGVSLDALGLWWTRRMVRGAMAAYGAV
ncbi:type II secretion system F family protein [Nocardiopsis sediminis]|uniref:Type II secretion system F family protein n=1 Tax=Nocardiopsis sediminis TaxID=1778267 RepID=A0ABV8FUW1_9ACTN